MTSKEGRLTHGKDVTESTSRGVLSTRSVELGTSLASKVLALTSKVLTLASEVLTLLLLVVVVVVTTGKLLGEVHKVVHFDVICVLFCVLETARRTTFRYGCRGSTESSTKQRLTDEWFVRL
jgi:hypothetical protein